MWAKFRSSRINKVDGMELRDARKSFNVNEEYLCALRTKSFADFFTKAQLLVNQLPASPSHCHHRFSEILLEPGQESIATVLESAILSKKSDLKALILNYFDISAEASKICSHLLRSVNQVHSNYGFIHRVLNTIDHNHQHDQFESINSDLRSFVILDNPFSNLDEQDFNLIRDKYSLVLHRLKAKRKKLARKMKLIKLFHKASGICATAACGLVAVAALVLAAHTLTALVMGPAIFSLPIKPLKKRLHNFQFLRIGFLRKVGEQLDVAAKGTYILNRDFDTISRLVARVHDEIEHNKAMVRLCLERREDKLCLQVLRQLKNSDVGFRKQVEELEEHVYLCLVTINKARALVIKEIAAASCAEAL